ncbi:YwqG family protein [Mucilaginibacter lacusdianchii]|uniref:YwqG family protein n=1 Tax=Mucilaginibacter lacusdianchii TaxID=2684211 RepID=UPI00131D2EB5|nr:DUF1963 domain-containing protein [Mucilaginibacter sp. JXJ CY 39]
MIPDFLKPFEKDIENYRLECVRISAKPTSEIVKNSVDDSKFLGVPFLPKYLNYPTDENGTPMIMLAQINFKDVPHLPDYPERGILQQFVSSTDWYSDESCVTLYHEDTNVEIHERFDFLTDNLFDESPIYREHKLFFTNKIEFGGTEDFRFNYVFNGMNYYNYLETLNKNEQRELDAFFDSAGHKIGGYAYFTQGDPRDYNPKNKQDVQLIQIDTDDHIMFGDSGVAHLFINETDLKAKRFENAYFYWDCC